MKKKVVTTLLSAMLCVSMVPMPVMAFEEDAESFEVTADDFGAGKQSRPQRMRQKMFQISRSQMRIQKTPQRVMWM